VSAPFMTAPPPVDFNDIKVNSFRVEELAGLVRMCGESIQKELVSIGKHCPGALVQHSQSVTDYIDTLADILCETAVQIRRDAEALAGCRVAVTDAKCFPSETQWREYQAACDRNQCEGRRRQGSGGNFQGGAGAFRLRCGHHAAGHLLQAAAAGPGREPCRPP
jgi:hypothetical protein